MAYDLTVLDPTEFEALVADLLSKSWDSRLESFKEGKDGGIDLRYSRKPANKPATIVQCKRYARSGFSSLHRSCKEEKKKLDKLKPVRYVLATSVSLSPANKDKLVFALAPWVKSTSDIYGADELKGLLGEFPEVERTHFKLWISSTAVMERVLHADVFSLTDATIEEARSELSKLVIHDGLKRALELLHEHHHVLIVGNPGIGKSTLARMLICHYLTQDFEPAWVLSDIRDAWRLFNEKDENRRLVVVYDDFLGRLRFDAPRFYKNEDVLLLKLIAMAGRSKGLRLILTTREYILEDAKRLHGAFDEQSNSLLTCLLSLEDYTKEHRARMVYNHLYFSDLPQTRLAKFVETKVYRDIVNHRHFNPRIVESVSHHANSRAMSDDEFIEFVKSEFNNPAKLWKHPFQHEISPLARKILFALWTFGGTVEVEDLLKTAAKMAKKSDKDPEFRCEFHEGLKQIDGNFVITNRYNVRRQREEKVYVVRFQNPSVEEFIDNQVACDASWLEDLAYGVFSIKQADRLLQRVDATARIGLSPDFWNALKKSGMSFEKIQVGRVQRFSFGVSQPVTFWEREFPTVAQATLTKLQIDARARGIDDETETIRNHVLSISGWQSIIDEIRQREDAAHHSLQLQRWVVENSGWPDGEKACSQKCLRAAILKSIEAEYLWLVSISSVVQLAQAITLVDYLVDERLRDALRSEANRSADGVLENADEPYELKEEADSLVELSELLCCPVDPLAEQLKERAWEMENEIESDHEKSPEHQSYVEMPADSFDLDELFLGLLDR